MFLNGFARRGLGAAAAVAAAALVLSACSGSEEPETEGTGEAVIAPLTIAVAQEPRSIDPAFASPPAVVWPAYDPLIYRADDGTLVPALAESWQYLDEENTQFELTIREGVLFSDGDELTAEAVAASLQRFIDEPENTDARYAGDISSIEATSDTTVVLTYASPNPSVAVALTQDYKWGLIVSPTGLENTDALTSETHGAGQYVLVSDKTVEGSTYVYEPNENYWNPDAIKFESVTYNVLPDTASQLSALQSGQADIAWNTSADNVQTALDAGFEYRSASGSTQFIMIQDRDGEPLDDPLVREAFAYAIDRDAIVDAVYSGLARAAYSLVLPGASGDYGNEIEYDVDNAKALLADAGYEDGIEVTMLSSGGWDPNYILSTALQGQLAEAGITVELETVGTGLSDFITPLYDMTYPTAQFGLSAGADTWFQLVTNAYGPGTIGNVAGDTDAEMDELLDAASKAQGDEFDSLMQQAVERFDSLYWLVPVVVSNGHYIINADLTNLPDESVLQQLDPFAPDAELSWEFTS